MKWILIAIVAGQPIDTGYQTEKAAECLKMAHASEVEFDAALLAGGWGPRTQKPIYTCITKGAAG